MRRKILFAAAAPLLLLTAQSWGAGPSPGSVVSDDPVAVQPLRNSFCRVLAPAGWTVVDQDDRGATYSVASPDRGKVATYGIAAISSFQAAGYYGPQYRRPAIFAQYLAETVAGQPIGITGSHPFDDMMAIDFQGGTKRGFVIYRVFPLQNDPGGYIVAARIAIGASTEDVAVAGAVAASIDCNTTFKAPPGGYAEVHATPSDTGTSQRCKAGDCNDSDLAGTYNAQLGTGYVHSASGTNYLVDVTTGYRETGPDGPGYYRQNGNFLEKLEPGRAD